MSDGVKVIVTTYHDKILWDIEEVMKHHVHTHTHTHTYWKGNIPCFRSSPNVLGFLNNLQTTLHMLLGPHRKWSLSNNVINTICNHMGQRNIHCMYIKHGNWPRICNNHVSYKQYVKNTLYVDFALASLDSYLTKEGLK